MGGAPGLKIILKVFKKHEKVLYVCCIWEPDRADDGLSDEKCRFDKANQMEF